MEKIGIIGGSGLDNPSIMEDQIEIEVETPYGKPSSPLKIGKIKGVDVVLIARHGKEHTLPPTQINFKANIHALKAQGCTHILATSAVGSLKSSIGRGDLVILDQFIDFTRHRQITFHDIFAENNPIHTPMAEPFSEDLRKLLIETCREMNLTYHKKGTVVTIEGPRFSTKGESKMFRIWGGDVINMTIAPEAILANEAGIPYAVVALSTDYDCWKDDEEPVSWEGILEIFKKNVHNVADLLINTIPKIRCAERTVENIKRKIRSIANFPKKDIVFRDITTLFQDPQGLQDVVSEFYKRYKDKAVDAVAGIEARGFILAGVLAHELGAGCVLVRKKGKLPHKTESITYDLEYGTDTIEIHVDAIKKGQNVVLIDDLLATGGTSLAAAKLIEKLGGKITEISVIVDLPELGGKKKLEQAGYKVFALVDFEGK